MIRVSGCALLLVLTLLTSTPMSAQDMAFFVTSRGPGEGGNLGGLTGADAHCQTLADAVGSGNRNWHAYMSTTVVGDSAVNARNRIGNGPWHNAAGDLIAEDVADLHEGISRLGKQNSLNENGQTIGGIGDDPNLHDILTGSLTDGTAAEWDELQQLDQ